MPAEWGLRPADTQQRFQLNLFYPPDVTALQAFPEASLLPPARASRALDAANKTLDQASKLSELSPDDPLLAATSNLSLPLLLSMCRMHRTSFWAAHTISKAYPDYLTGHVAETAKLVDDTYAGVSEVDNPRWSESIKRFVEDSRHNLAYYVVGDMLRSQGVDLQKDLLDPLKLFEMQIGYEPYDPALENRVRGLHIPKELRALQGNLELAAHAKAGNSLISTLIQSYQWLISTNSYYMGLFRQELEKEFGVRLQWDGKQFHTISGTIDESRLGNVARNNELMQAMSRIIEAENGEGFGFTRVSDVSDMESFVSWAHPISVMLVDPYMNDPLLHYPDIEMVMHDSLQIPKSSLYIFHQTHTALLAFGNLNISRKKRDKR